MFKKNKTVLMSSKLSKSESADFEEKKALINKKHVSSVLVLHFLNFFPIFTYYSHQLSPHGTDFFRCQRQYILF